MKVDCGIDGYNATRVDEIQLWIPQLHEAFVIVSVSFHQKLYYSIFILLRQVLQVSE
jgi:hypothetical protein